MNNFDFKRHPKRRHDKRAIDGFIKPSANEGSINFRRTTSYRPGASTISDFKRPDGFHPSAQPSITAPTTVPVPTTTASILEEPSPVAKRRRFLRRKHRKGLHKPRNKWLTRAKRGALVLSALVLLTGGFLGIKAYLKARNIFKGGSDGAAALQKDVDPSLLKGEGDGRVNMLLLGKGGEGHEAPDLTDTIIIASIDPIHKEAALLSIPRDLYVKVPGNGSMKINAVYATYKNNTLAKGKYTAQLAEEAEKAGLEAIDKTVESTMGIPIHYHAMVDFTGFKKAIDTVGGVDVNVTDSLYEVMRIDGKQYVLNVQTGQQHFDGFRALAYARSRYTSVRGDFDRAERQRLIMTALKDKIFSLGTFSNPLKLSQLMDAFGDHIQTNLSIDELSRLYTIGKEIPSSNIKSIGLADPPNNYVVTDNINGLSVVVPRAGVNNFTEIQSYVRNTMKDGFIKQENPSVMVLNGTETAGLATRKAEELKSYGYNVTKIGDAPTKNYTQTVLVDLRNGSKKYTKRYLEQRFKTTARTSLPDSTIVPENADFVIILGQNDATTSN
jgi:LCP family protein required for cell wall assembly